MYTSVRLHRQPQTNMNPPNGSRFEYCPFKEEHVGFHASLGKVRVYRGPSSYKIHSRRELSDVGFWGKRICMCVYVYTYMHTQSAYIYIYIHMLYRYFSFGMQFGV